MRSIKATTRLTGNNIPVRLPFADMKIGIFLLSARRFVQNVIVQRRVIAFAIIILLYKNFIVNNSFYCWPLLTTRRLLTFTMSCAQLTNLWIYWWQSSSSNYPNTTVNSDWWKRKDWRPDKRKTRPILLPPDLEKFNLRKKEVRRRRRHSNGTMLGKKQDTFRFAPFSVFVRRTVCFLIFPTAFVAERERVTIFLNYRMLRTVLCIFGHKYKWS